MDQGYFAHAQYRMDLEAFANKAYRDSYLETHVHFCIANQVQVLRTDLGLTQVEFAEKIKKPQSVVSRLENPDYGKVTVQTLLDVATELDIALVIKFASYPEFIRGVNRISRGDLSVNNIYESIRESDKSLLSASIDQSISAGTEVAITRTADPRLVHVSSYQYGTKGILIGLVVTPVIILAQTPTECDHE